MSDQYDLNPPFRPGFPSREQIAQWESWELSDGITNRFRYLDDHPHVWRGFRWRPIDINHREAACAKKSYRPVDGTTPQQWSVAPPPFLSDVPRLAKYNMMPQQLWGGSCTASSERMPMPPRKGPHIGEDPTALRKRFVDIIVKSLREFGCPSANEQNVFTEHVYSTIFLQQLREGLGGLPENKPKTREFAQRLIDEIENKAQANKDKAP